MSQNEDALWAVPSHRHGQGHPAGPDGPGGPGGTEAEAAQGASAGHAAVGERHQPQEAQPQEAPTQEAQVPQPAAVTSVPGSEDDQPALAVVNLSKAFGQKVAVSSLTMSVPAGSVFGVVGPNGAGKTTTLSMATGLLTPDAGRVLVHGVDVWADPVRAKAQLGVLPDGLRTFDRLSGLDLVTYSGLLRGMERATVVERATQLLHVLDLWDAGTKLVADYSAGMRKKVHLACALVHSPSVLVLDEPFEAVDPISAQTIQGLLTDFTAAGGTVIISSHVMATVERLCTHVAVIAGGRLLAAGTTEEVAAGEDLDTRFAQLVGAPHVRKELSWLRPSSR